MFERINVIKSHILDTHDIDYVYKKKCTKIIQTFHCCNDTCSLMFFLPNFLV